MLLICIKKAYEVFAFGHSAIYAFFLHIRPNIGQNLANNPILKRAGGAKDQSFPSLEPVLTASPPESPWGTPT